MYIFKYQLKINKSIIISFSFSPFKTTNSHCRHIANSDEDQDLIQLHYDYTFSITTNLYRNF
jgi:hypothetical protein